MDSRFFKRIKFNGWFTFNEIRAILEDHLGVYVIKKRTGIFQRLKGYSDILYIGSGRSLAGTHKQYSGADLSRATRNRICNFYKNHDGILRMRIGYRYVSDEKCAKELEKKLLEKYERDHWELPAFNRKEG